MKALDLFCGLGGWSDGLAAEGFDVMGVEIEPKIAALYKHKVIVADICELNPEEFKGYDLIVGSPPCRNFSQLIKVIGHTWKKHPPDPWGDGLRLVNAFLNFVIIAEPHYWLMENVPGLADYLWQPPRTISYLGKTMKRAFWGNFPSFLVPRDYNKGTMIGHRDVKEKRGKPDPTIGDIFEKGNRKGQGWVKKLGACPYPSSSGACPRRGGEGCPGGREMRVCPRCGYEDPICWRPALYHQEYSYADFSSLELLDPELWEALKTRRRGEIVERGPYLYWRSSRRDTVRRIWVEDYKRVGKRGNPRRRFASTSSSY